jgi:hypothetical protein
MVLGGALQGAFCARLQVFIPWATVADNARRAKSILHTLNENLFYT